MNCFMEEEKMTLEMEFFEFLIQRLKHADGSLPFHHLFGHMQQARFEIRNAFGTTKSELMKFLKSRAKIFHIDSVGMVTILSASPSNDDSYGSDIYDTEGETLIRKIECGIGIVMKLNPEFGIIKAVEPLETEVHFKSEALSGNKDMLLTDSCLKVGHEVYFNAVYGNDDYDIKFRATRTWQNFETKMNFDDSSEKQKAVSILQGEGIIKKISANQGSISVLGKETEIVFFDKNSVIDCNDMELTKFFKVNDPVEFSASRKDLKAQWRATVVRKKSKSNIQSILHTKIKPTVKNKIENEPGKICLHSHGAIIKFGKEYCELADGDSSIYFLYGAEITEIAFEFSDGDDVWFDAIKTKSAPGWRAILVWVGEKPDYVDKKLTGEEVNEFSYKSNALTKNNLANSLKSESRKYENDVSVTRQIQNKGKVDNAIGRKASQAKFQCKKQNFKSSGSFQNSSANKPMNRKKGTRPGKEISLESESKDNQYRTAVGREVRHKTNQKKLAKNDLVDTRELISSRSDEDYDDIFNKNNVSDASEGSFSSDEFQSMLHNDKNLIKQRHDRNFASASKYNFADCNENDIENMCNESKCHKSDLKGTASIKMFEGINGEIISLYCKAAIVTSSQLEKNIDFVLNAFYINGKSVEEQQVIDLKEVIKVGDHVNFNCFEIIDDSGKIHQKVTLAWKGTKPNVYEITPQEFIDEQELSVTVSDELVSENLQDQRIASHNSSNDMLNSEETVATEHGSLPFFPSNSSEDISDIKMPKRLKFAENQTQDNLEKKDSDVHKLLSEMIIHRLKNKGVISADFQVDFSSMLKDLKSLFQEHVHLSGYKNYAVNQEVNTELKKVSQTVCLTCSGKNISDFPCKNKTEKHAAVQTIITGEIAAQNGNFTEKLEFGELSS